MSGAIARLTVTWFVLVGGWEGESTDRRQDLILMRLASWLWPPALWRSEGRVPPTTVSVLLELQHLGVVELGARAGNDVPATLTRALWLPDSILAEIDAILAKRREPVQGDAQ